MRINEPENVLNKIKNNLYLDNKSGLLAILMTLIIFFINNFNFIITKGLAPDALLNSGIHISNLWELSLGRFGLIIIDLIRFGIVDRFLIMVNCSILIALTSYFMMKTFKIKNKLAIIMIASIIGTAPQFTETYFFIYCADAYMVAILLSTLSGYFLDKAFYNKEKKYYVFSILCIIFTCSLYQAYLGVVIGLNMLLIISYILKNEDVKSIIKHAVKVIFTIAIAVIIYYLVLKFLLIIFNTQLASYKGANSLDINTIMELPTTIKQCYKDFYEFLFGNSIINNSPWHRKQINLILIILLTFNILAIFIKNIKDKRLMRLAIILTLIFLLPIGMEIMNLVAPETSINLVTGPGIICVFVLFIITYNALEENNIINFSKYIQILSIFVLVITFILENNITYLMRQETFNNYYTIQNDIYNKVTSLDGYNFNMKWMFGGIFKYNSSYAWMTNGFVSCSNETYDFMYDNTRWQIIKFYKNYMGIDIILTNQDEEDKIRETEQYKNMDVYPNDNSIAIINDIVVVKVE